MKDLPGTAPIGFEDAFTLAAAREAVLAAIQTARSIEALDDAAATELEAHAAAIDDVYALDGLVRAAKPLDRQICRFPGCFHPAQDGRNAYCAQVRDAAGGAKHTPTRSMRLRNWLESGAIPAEPLPDDPAGARPVSLARMSIPEQIARVEQVAEAATTQLTNAIGELRRQVALVGDDEARAAEIESVRYDEGKKVEEARGAQLAAERRERNSRQLAEAAEQARAEAVEAAEEANIRADSAERAAAEQAERAAQAVSTAQAAAEQARAEADTAIADADTRIQQVTADADARIAAAEGAAAARIADAERTAQQRIQTAETDAQNRIREATEHTDREIARIRAEADSAIAAAQAEAQTAQSAAETAAEQTRAAQAAAAEARQKSVRDETAAAAAREELTNTRADRDRLQQRYDATESRHRNELATLTDRLDTLQTRLDDNQQAHQDELRRLATERTTERAQDEARAAAQLDSIQRAHDAQVESLNERINLMQHEINRARSSQTPPTASQTDQQ